MIKCPICGKQKAKRYCLVKDFDICPACCGQNRVVKFKCPDECPHVDVHRRRSARKVQQHITRHAEKDAQLLEVLYANLETYSPYVDAAIHELVEVTAKDFFYTDALFLQALDDLMQGPELMNLQTEDMEMNRVSVIKFTLKEALRKAQVKYSPLSSSEIRMVLMGLSIYLYQFVQDHPDSVGFIRFLQEFKSKSEEHEQDDENDAEDRSLIVIP